MTFTTAGAPASRLRRLRAELDCLSGHEAALKLVLRTSDQHIGKLAERFVRLNWFGETPAEIEPEEQYIIDLLNAYDAAARTPANRLQ
jgi:hypothetical protein